MYDILQDCTSRSQAFGSTDRFEEKECYDIIKDTKTTTKECNWSMAQKACAFFILKSCDDKEISTKEIIKYSEAIYNHILNSQKKNILISAIFI